MGAMIAHAVCRGSMLQVHPSGAVYRKALRCKRSQRPPRTLELIDLSDEGEDVGIDL